MRSASLPVLGVAVLVVAGIAGKDWIREGVGDTFAKIQAGCLCPPRHGPRRARKVKGSWSAAHGTMQGTYQMIRDDGQRFDAEITPFLLALPNSLNYARPPGSAPDKPSISAVSRGMARSRLRR